MRRIKLGIIDDSVFCRNLTKLQLLNFDNVKFDFVLEAESITDFQSKAKAIKMPDVILLDIMMPGIDGISGIPIIRQQFPEVHIIMLSDVDKPSIIRNCILAGAYSFVKKGTKTCELVDIILDVLTGSCYASPELTKSIFCGIQKSPQAVNKLSENIAKSTKLTVDGLWELINRILDKLNVPHQNSLIS